ncbi:TPA: DUF3850 domain-containing protein [Escherichia coli]|nr:DUF3850 domain-containing protein [Escherichia coli]
MMAKIHEVKLHAKYFDLVLEGKKRAEFRKNDRNYERGDTLILHEWVADRVTVQSAAIVEYQINATLYLYPGPESEPIRAAAVKKLEAYITAQHRLGRDIRLSAIYAALHVEGVQRVELASPLADIVLNSTQASFCTEYRVVTGGSDE